MAALAAMFEEILVRVERELPCVRAGFRSRPRSGRPCVAVFHRKRKVAGHERRAHAFELTLGHAPGKHERLGAAADRAVKRPHAYFARFGRRQRFLADLGLSGPLYQSAWATSSGRPIVTLLFPDWTLGWFAGYIIEFALSAEGLEVVTAC